MKLEIPKLAWISVPPLASALQALYPSSTTRSLWSGSSTFPPEKFDCVFYLT